MAQPAGALAGPSLLMIIKCDQHFRRRQPPEGAETGPSLFLINPQHAPCYHYSKKPPNDGLFGSTQKLRNRPLNSSPISSLLSKSTRKPKL